MASVLDNLGASEITGATIAIGALSIAAYGIFAPRCSMLCPVISRGRQDGPAGVSLTFDDGPHPEATPATLDTLRDLGAPAAFFVIGAHAQRWPDLVRRIDAEGHLVCNHTYAHSHFGGFAWNRRWESELRRADDAIAQAIGKRPAIFRPPWGIKTPHTFAAVRQTGHAVVTWTLRAYDGVPTNPQRIVRRLVPRAKPGDIIAMHDGLVPPARRNLPATVEAIGPLVRGLRDRGLDAVRLDRLTGLVPYVPLG